MIDEGKVKSSRGREVERMAGGKEVVQEERVRDKDKMLRE